MEEDEQLEEQAEEAGYGAAEGESDDAPEQVQRTDVEREREKGDEEIAPGRPAPPGPRHGAVRVASLAW